MSEDTPKKEEKAKEIKLHLFKSEEIKQKEPKKDKELAKEEVKANKTQLSKSEEKIAALSLRRSSDFAKIDNFSRPSPRKHSILATILFHTQRVSCIAEQIFDDLAHLHNLPNSCKKILVSASLLHDIGFVRGRDKHHKTSETIILSAETGIITDDIVGDEDLRVKVDVTLDSILGDHTPKEIELIALIARYHRKAEPSVKHKKFKALSKKNREIVRCLAGILRIADALDFSHRRDIRKVHLLVKDKIVLQLFGDKAMWKDEIKRVNEKKGLFEDVFKRTLKCQIVSNNKTKEKKKD